MGFLHRLGSALVHYGVIGTIIAVAVLVGVMGYSQADIVDDVKRVLSEDYLEGYEAEGPMDVRFELVLLLAPLPIFLYRYFAYDHTGPIGELLLFFLAGANPILGTVGILLYLGTSKN